MYHRNLYLRQSDRCCVGSSQSDPSLRHLLHRDPMMHLFFSSEPTSRTTRSSPACTSGSTLLKTISDHATRPPRRPETGRPGPRRRSMTSCRCLPAPTGFPVPSTKRRRPKSFRENESSRQLSSVLQGVRRFGSWFPTNRLFGVQLFRSSLSHCGAK